MALRAERVLGEWLASGARGIGQILLRRNGDGFSLCHHEDEACAEFEVFHSPNDAVELAKFDDGGNYRPLKTAPNLRHGWRLELENGDALKLALEFFYPGRLAALAAWEANQLAPTPLRATLDRQTGMYRIAAQISDQQIDTLVGGFCRSRGGAPGCLRTIMWRRDERGARPSVRLPLDKFIAPLDQTGRGEKIIPLLCQEACNLLVAEARRVVKEEPAQAMADPL
jgi:sirohydrochlorin cobaltochelatase